ncbi:MAG: hypothetical protein R6U89_01685 [Dehalococcoidia bacterium]
MKEQMMVFSLVITAIFLLAGFPASAFAVGDELPGSMTDKEIKEQVEALTEDAKKDPVPFAIVNGKVKKIKKGTVLARVPKNENESVKIEVGAYHGVGGYDISVGANENGEIVVQEVLFQKHDNVDISTNSSTKSDVTHYRVWVNREVQDNWTQVRQTEVESKFSYLDDGLECYNIFHPSPYRYKNWWFDWTYIGQFYYNWQENSGPYNNWCLMVAYQMFGPAPYYTHESWARAEVAPGGLNLSTSGIEVYGTFFWGNFHSHFKTDLYEL